MTGKNISGPDVERVDSAHRRYLREAAADGQRRPCRAEPEAILPRFAHRGLGSAGGRALEGQDTDDRITPREELGIDRALGAPLAPSALGRAPRGPAPAALPGAAIEDNLYRVVVVERAPERVVERPALASDDEEQALDPRRRHARAGWSGPRGTSGAAASSRTGSSPHAGRRWR